MSDLTQPVGNVPHQVQSTTPITRDNTLVDDTVALVDDATALSNGLNTPIQGLGVTASTNAPKGSIQTRR